MAKRNEFHNDLGTIALGLVFVMLGLAIFIRGLEMALFPLGETLAARLAAKHATAEEVKVLRTDHEGFGIPQAVVEAVRKYRFKPATKAGVRVTSHATVTQRYQFRNR